MTGNLFSSLVAKILGGALLAALLLAGVQTYRVGYWKRVAVSLRLDLDRIKLAQELAASQWQTKLSEQETKQRQAIQGARNDERKKAMLAAGDAYARSNRVRTQAVKGPGPKPADAKADPASRDDRSGADSEMVAVTPADFDILVSNTIRLDTVQRQAEALIASGVAVREAEPTR